MASQAVSEGASAAPPRGSARKRRPWRRRRAPENIRITKVGLWYVLFTVLVAIAATNTGNNALYMVVAMMLGTLVVSGLVSRHNVDGLEVELSAPPEVFAKQPLVFDVHLENRSRLFGHWYLLLAVSRSGPPLLVHRLERGGSLDGQLELILPSRGRKVFKALHVTSLFPFGFFRKGVRYRTEVEILVYPELYPAAASAVPDGGRLGGEPSRRAGWGHELHALRGFRPGDDPRSIHWKQSARTGDLVYMEREAEDSRRLSVLLDNGAGALEDEAGRNRFEHLVSEAATSALDHLDRGFEVELVTRDRALPFGVGRRHRRALLEHLALIQPVERVSEPLRSTDPGAPRLWLTMDPLASPGQDAPGGMGTAATGSLEARGGASGGGFSRRGSGSKAPAATDRRKAGRP